MRKEGRKLKFSKHWIIFPDSHRRNSELGSGNDNSEDNKKIGSRKARRRGNNPKRKKGRKNQGNENMPDPPDVSAFPKTGYVDEMKMKKKNILVNRQISTIVNQTKPVKFYNPLQLFVELQMDPTELYERFLLYIMQHEELKKNGFPLFSPSNPGKVTINQRYPSPSETEEDPCQRWCCRCGQKYKVLEDNTYIAETGCFYHNGKRHGAGPYTCCGQYTSEGCMISKHHVSNSTTLYTVKYMQTRDKRYKPNQNTVYALDCEMCYTIKGLEVTRVSIVGTDGLTVYDSYVLPESPIVDYNTEYSGITANDLKDVKTTLADVQAFLLKFLSARTVLVGHALENDLKALRIVHELIVDTSVVFPHHYGFPYKRSLKSISASILEHAVQESPGGHDSVEDARACIELMLWKVQSDSSVFMIPKTTIIPKPTVIPIQTTPQWTVTPLTFNPFMTYNLGYWVPPVGAHCDMY